jgi:hypothetical protein
MRDFHPNFFQKFWIGDKELILIQNSSILGRMEDNPIYFIILDSSKREREINK